MFGISKLGYRVWVFGGVEFKATKGQVEVVRKGRWSLHHVKDVKTRKGVRWKNYTLYFDALGLAKRPNRLAWHIAYDGERIAHSQGAESLRAYNPRVMEFVTTAIVNCPVAALKLRTPPAPRDAPIGRPKGVEVKAVPILLDVDAKIEEQIDRQWRIGVPLSRRRGFTDIFAFCKDRLGVKRPYVQSFLERKLRVGRVKHDAFKGGYKLAN